MAYHEAKGGGTSREKLEKGLHHVRIYGGEGADGKSKGFWVEHHVSENDRKPQVHHFPVDGSLLMEHLAQHVAGVSNTSGRADRESDEQGNLSGRDSEEDGQD